MQITTIIEQAWVNIRAAKLRATLAILGILIGTASVVALVSAGNMAVSSAMEAFQTMNTQNMTMNLWRENPNDVNDSSFGVDELREIQSKFSHDKPWLPYQVLFMPVHFDGMEYKVQSLATVAQAQSPFRLAVSQGRPLSFLDDKEYYCVVGAHLADKFKQSHKKNIIGSQVLIGEIYFTIIGIYKENKFPLFIGGDMNDGILFSIGLMQQLGKAQDISSVLINIDGQKNVEALQEQIRKTLFIHHPSLKIMFQDPRQLLEGIRSQQRIFVGLLGLIGSIALLVGGIGIMNVMLVSVVQRQREVGLRKALGARARDIRRLFIAEAILLALTGGVLGIILGLVASKIISIEMQWPFHIYIVPIVYGFTVSVITGLFFGFYPAHKAAKACAIKSINAMG